MLISFNELEKDLTITEIALAIRSMQIGKAPGPDGFPADFYKKKFWSALPLLFSVFNESLTSKVLPPSMHQAIISLLVEEKDKNPLN